VPEEGQPTVFMLHRVVTPGGVDEAVEGYGTYQS
jgi:hypothetical protein